MNINYRRIVLVAGLISTISIGHSEPLINSATASFEDNTPMVTLSGTDFGVRSKKDDANAPNAPLLSSNFEYDDQGNITEVGLPVVESLSQWTDKGTEVMPAGFERRAFFSDLRRSSELANNRSIKMTHRKVQGGEKAAPIIVAQNLDFKKTGKIFFSYWVKFKWPNENPDISYQFKLSTIVTDIAKGGTVYGGADMQLANWMYLAKDGSGPYTKSAYRNMNGSGKGSNSLYFATNTLEPTTDNWRNVVLFWEPGPANETKGKIWSWISKGNNIPIVQLQGLDKFYAGKQPMLATYDNPASDFPNSLKLAWYVSKLSDWNVDVYFDDVVADNSWAQIFVGDQPNFDDCTILELQQVIDWQVGDNGADDMAKFPLRYGSLLKDATLYVYLLNEDGLFSKTGFSIEDVVSKAALEAPKNVVVDPI